MTPDCSQPRSGVRPEVEGLGFLQQLPSNLLLELRLCWRVRLPTVDLKLGAHADDAGAALPFTPRMHPEEVVTAAVGELPPCRAKNR